MNEFYKQGFIDKCAELGIDPDRLVKIGLNPLTVLSAARPMVRRSLARTNLLRPMRAAGYATMDDMVAQLDKQKTLGRGLMRYGKKLPADTDRSAVGSFMDAGEGLATGGSRTNVMRAMDNLEAV